ncbi:hypothetical protein C8R44DRAFT_742608 [Mycena epipterygia]|nr:hypothetical protein C8R44DRAFT_742608 [Mycena epipterygia]
MLRPCSALPHEYMSPFSPNQLQDWQPLVGTSRPKYQQTRPNWANCVGVPLESHTLGAFYSEPQKTAPDQTFSVPSPELTRAWPRCMISTRSHTNQQNLCPIDVTCIAHASDAPGIQEIPLAPCSDYSDIPRNVHVPLRDAFQSAISHENDWSASRNGTWMFEPNLSREVSSKDPKRTNQNMVLEQWLLKAHFLRFNGVVRTVRDP